MQSSLPIFLINRIPTSSLENKIPHSILFPNEPLYHGSHKVFGCTCFVHDVSLGLDKLSARAIKCVFLGYSLLLKGYKCYSPTTRRYYMSVDVTFFKETVFFSKQDDSNSIQQVLPIPCLNAIVSPTHTTSNKGEIQPSSPVNHQDELSPTSVSTYQSGTQKDGDSKVHEDTLDSCPSPSVVPTTDPSSSSSSHDPDSGWPIALRKAIWSTRNPHPIYLSYHRLSPSYFSSISSSSSITVPKNVCEALAHTRWRQAMIVEMQAFEHSGTWELVPLPPGKKVVGCQWVYATKLVLMEKLIVLRLDW